jgi:serine/threonine-protein kinase
MTDISRLADALAGRYTVEREVGEGGMATVYLARDLRHDRPVALKVLRPELGAVLGVERFLAEIKVTANLQHPNLLPLFDSGAAEGFLYYVMPFVEDESLRARLDRERQLPVDEAVHIATSVAGALDYAHRQGVIHRDLKPENILMHEGEPLVADFGIALAVSNAGGGRITQTGLSLGTPQYMSPEQATGDRVVDGRTDIYSLGALTYEMLTGEAPHTGTTSQAVIARLLTEAPRPVRATRSSVPAHVEGSVERALAKLPADRFATAKEFADGLTGRIVVEPAPGTVGSEARARRTTRERRLVGALVLTAVLWVATGLFALTRPAVEAEAPQVRFEIRTPESVAPYQFSVAPDGSALVYGVVEDGVRSLWVRRLDAVEPTRIEGTEGATYGSFSLDSREIVFPVEGRLRRVDLEGGAPVTIAEFPSGDRARGGAWGPDGTILFEVEGGLYRVAASGGEPVRLEIPGLAEPFLRRVLPDGVHVLVHTLNEADGEGGVYVVSLDGGPPIRVTESGSKVGFAAPDQLLYMRDNTLYAQTMEMRGFQLMGEPVRIADNVAVNPVNGNAGFAASDNGVLVTLPVGPPPERQFWWYGRSGERLAPVGGREPFLEFSLSPDEARVAVRTSGQSIDGSNLRVTDLASEITSSLTTRPDGGVSNPVWSRDSRAVTYRAGDSVLVRRLGGTRDSVLVVGAGRPLAYTPDGETLLLWGDDRELRALSTTEGGTTRVLDAPGIRRGVRFSPDGRWVSYHTENTGAEEVWVASYPSFENRRQVSADGGLHARWRGDGQELFFLDPDGWVMAAAVIPGPTPAFEAPVALFKGPGTPPSYGEALSVSADGQRFLFLEGDEDDAGGGGQSLVVLLNAMTASGRN